MREWLQAAAHLRPGKHHSRVVSSDATYETNKADVTAWSTRLGCQGLDSQLGGILTDKAVGTHAWAHFKCGSLQRPPLAL